MYYSLNPRKKSSPFHLQLSINIVKISPFTLKQKLLQYKSPWIKAETEQRFSLNSFLFLSGCCCCSLLIQLPVHCIMVNRESVILSTTS